MLKVLLFFVSLLCAGLFVTGCAVKDLDKEDYAGNIKERTGVCADIAFKKSRDKLNEANRLKALNRDEDANRAYNEAYNIYLQEELDYINLQGQVNNAMIALNQQKSRLDTVGEPAGKAATGAFLKNAESMINACKPQEAMYYIDEAQKVLK